MNSENASSAAPRPQNESEVITGILRRCSIHRPWQAIAFSLVVLFAGTAAARRETVPRFQRFPLDPSPGWVVSGAWTQDGNLALVDTLRSEILVYSPKGKLLRKVQSPNSGPIAFLKPSIISPDKAGFILEDQDGRMIWLDQMFKPFKEVDLLQKGKGALGQLKSVFGWALQGSDFIIFGDLLKPNGDWASGYFRVPAAAPQRFSALQWMDVKDPARRFFLIGSPLIATAGSDTYFVRMDVEPVLSKVEGTSQTVKAVASEMGRLGHRPVLPLLKGTAGVRDLYRALELSDTPSGLYSSKGRLYVLMRRTSAAGSTWELDTVDPASGRLTLSKILPTSANHVTVVPGETDWAIIEKGPVKAVGTQEIPSILIIPSAEIEN